MNYQILLEKEQSVLRKNTISSLEHGSETDRRLITPTHNRIDFLLCPSCFWCPHILTTPKYLQDVPFVIMITSNLCQFQMVNSIHLATIEIGE